jgi:hypothetical protein
MPIARALLKYGYSNFKLEILEYCSPEDVIKREEYYLKIFEPYYNILKIAGSSLGYTHSQETKDKMSAAKKGENHPCLGRTGEKHPLFGKPRAEGSGRPPQQISVIDNQTNQTTTYDSMWEAARALNIECSIITNYLKNNQRKPYKKRYIFKKM